MATKIIKALVDGVVQEIEVEDITSPTPEPTVEDRVEDIENELVITDGNFLVGSGTTDLYEMTPEDVLVHINATSHMVLSEEEYNAIGEDSANANTLYLVDDGEESATVTYVDTKIEEVNDSHYTKIETDELIDSLELITTDDIDIICGTVS